MAKVMVSARLDGELSGWAKKYAKRRDVSLATVLEQALREFREACEGGPQDRVVNSRTGEVLEVVQHPTSSEPMRVRAPRPSRSEWEATMRDRQARLNKGKG